MAIQKNPFLANWVRNAYSMEMGLVPVLEQQTKAIKDDPQLQQGLEHHLQQTRHHVDLLKGCLQRMGENIAGIQPANPMASLYGTAVDGSPDIKMRAELIDFVTENYEAASYRALGTLASRIGDQDTAQVCEEILKDEVAIVRALDRRLPMNGQAREMGATRVEDNIKLARAAIDALNTHDLTRFEQCEADDVRVETPGAMGTLDRQKYSDFLRDTFAAFPDMRFEINRIIAQDDAVVTNWTCTGTHDGQLRMPDGPAIQPTHKKVRTSGSTTGECQNGKFARLEVFFDNAAFLSQLGLAPHP